MSAVVAPDEAVVDAREAPAVAAARPRWQRRLRGLAGLSVLGVVAAAPWWGPKALGRLDFFHVRRVEIDGARYVAPSDVLGRLKVDTSTSVWADLEPLGERVAAHPLVQGARVERRFPGTLRVVLVERVPVGMAPARDGFTVLDAEGRALPVEPNHVGGLDVPLVPARDTALLRLLGAMRDDAPALFARVSEARRVGRDEIELRVSGGLAELAPSGLLRVRVGRDATVGRLADVLPVEDDLTRRRARVVEIDLRFRDQVIARLQ